MINSITQFQELHWDEVTIEKIIQMEEDSKKYNDLCVKLPKDLKEWQAYKELRQSIANLQELLPLITVLKRPSIKDSGGRKGKVPAEGEGGTAEVCKEGGAGTCRDCDNGGGDVFTSKF